MESVDLDVNQFFKAMESVLGRSKDEPGNEAGFDGKSSSSDIDLGISFLHVMQMLFHFTAVFCQVLTHMVSYLVLVRPILPHERSVLFLFIFLGGLYFGP